MSIYLFMLLYIIWGMGWGLLCLGIAKEKNKNPRLWLILGFLFSIVAFLFLIKRPSDEEKPFICPSCGYSINGNDKYCSNCGELLEEEKDENIPTKF